MTKREGSRLWISIFLKMFVMLMKISRIPSFTAANLFEIFWFFPGSHKRLENLVPSKYHSCSPLIVQMVDYFRKIILCKKSPEPALLHQLSRGKNLWKLILAPIRPIFWKSCLSYHLMKHFVCSCLFQFWFYNNPLIQLSAIIAFDQNLCLQT